MCLKLLKAMNTVHAKTKATPNTKTTGQCISRKMSATAILNKLFNQSVLPSKSFFLFLLLLDRRQTEENGNLRKDKGRWIWDALADLNH